MLWLIRRAVQVAVLTGAAIQVAGLAQAFHPLFDSIAHFRLHLTAALAAGIVVLFVLRCGRSALAALAVLVAGGAGMAPALGSLQPEPAGAGRDLVLLQFNTRFTNPKATKIVEQVRATRADVVTLQEVSNLTSAVLVALARDYPHQVSCPFTAVGGVAVLSRWPVLDKGCDGMALGLGWLRLDVEGRTVTVASLHLHWPYPFGQFDQIASLDPVFRALPQPLVLAGDFNAAPWSEAVARVAAATSTHVAPGIRLSLKLAPFGLRPWPVLPIDHVLLPRGAHVAEVYLGREAGSDHLPVIAHIRLAGD